ncbi:DUF2812 domain-containing protein [Sporosarcina limicola]|uniref:DUF2812 domain-containing protein n=1 Tax=Sporosarcina limicola TaxID=34101 RepID=A0A927MEA2_9BACL|nr:DUF2812 domain-containing protein [Sporosarcina limicola]MBE1553159.1 hypothetical protein [Sporosarcina limicola]
MTMKRWKPFWSYDVEKTECWLSKMAAEGKRVTGLNRLTRMFSFEESARSEVEYQWVYYKYQHTMPQKLEESGWEMVLTEGNWQLINNETDAIHAYPSREGILKRNRLHSTVLTGISILYGFQLSIVLIMLMVMFSLGPAEGNVKSSPLWSIPILYFLQGITVIGLTIHATRKLRAFERKFFSTEVDELSPIGKTFVKWKFGWMHVPDQIENWLSDMAAEGNHLIRVGKPVTRFTFEKGAPKRTSFIYDFQFKASPTYYDVHKSAGWQLKFTSPYSIMKYSLWMKQYEEDEGKPRFTYDSSERKAQVQKVLLSTTGIFLLMVAVAIFFLSLNYSMYRTGSWSLFNKIIFAAFIVTFSFHIVNMVRTLKYALRMRRNSFAKSD